MIYALHYHVGTPSKSKVVYSENFEADNDLHADKIRQEREKKCTIDYDFNLVCQAEYLANQGLADSIQRKL